MSEFSVLKDIQESLRLFLLTNIPELVGDDAILFDSPAEISEQTSEKVSIFLYQIVENTHFKNSERELSAGNLNRLAHPPLTLDLYYLITPYGPSKERELLLTERLMLLLYDHPVLRPPLLQGSLTASGNNEIRVFSHNLSFEEINKLWERFPNKPYKLSLAYLLTPVRIPSTRADDIDRVREKRIEMGRI